jgi:hypothetical protein
VSGAGCGSRTLRVRRKILLLPGEANFKTVVSVYFILKQDLKQTRSVGLRAFSPAMSSSLRLLRDFAG